MGAADAHIEHLSAADRDCVLASLSIADVTATDV